MVRPEVRGWMVRTPLPDTAPANETVSALIVMSVVPATPSSPPETISKSEAPPGALLAVMMMAPDAARTLAELEEIQTPAPAPDALPVRSMFPVPVVRRSDPLKTNSPGAGPVPTASPVTSISPFAAVISEDCVRKTP